MSFRLLIDFEVLEFALKLSKSQQGRLFAHFLAMRDFPGNYSDLVEVGERGRQLNVCFFGDFQIRYWIDDADRHIKILRIMENE
jgi:hypothetical protein